MSEEPGAQRIQHLFVVRIWREANLTPGGPWRGLVEHIPSKHRLYFTSLGDLNDFVQWRLNETSPVDETDEV